MPSYLEKQSNAFKGTLASAATKIGDPSKTSKAPPSPLPSSSQSKRKRDGAATADGNSTPLSTSGSASAAAVAMSEPTSFGSDVLTQMTFAVEYLKKKGDEKTMTEIIDHLSLRNHSEQHKKELATGLRRHPRVVFTPHRAATGEHQGWTNGTYAHRPIIPGVRDAESLLAYLQKKTDASGVSVRDLKDGWPDCEETLQTLEDAHKILVVRTKKDNLPRYVCPDDPSLHHAVQPEFQQMWHHVGLPSLDEMHRKLVNVGQKPTSDDPRKAAVGTTSGKKQQKKRVAKKLGKATNMHMAHLMNDYSGMRR